jgi:hypothetical protein
MAFVSSTARISTNFERARTHQSEEAGSTGSAEMSAFHQLSAGKMRLLSDPPFAVGRSGSVGWEMMSAPAPHAESNSTIPQAASRVMALLENVFQS